VALFAIGQADGGADLGAGEVLEDFEVLGGFISTAGALECARQLKLSRGVVRVDLKGLLEDGYGLVKLLSSTRQTPAK